MTRTEYLPISLTRCQPVGRLGEPRFDVVWLSGDHDASTKVAVAAVISRAAELDSADVVVDLSGVTFMDASIVGTLVGARNRLRLYGLSLQVRAPSPHALHVLELCGVADLLRVLDLGAWADVPTAVAPERLRTSAARVVRGRF